MTMSRTALVTGSNGFIGSHLVEKLADEGFDVRCMLRKTSDQRWINGVTKNCVYADFTDFETLKEAVEGADEIYHLGGTVRTVHSRKFYEINSLGTHNIAEAVRRFNPNISRFVYVSSQAAWGPSGNGPVSHYGKSKRDGEKWVKGTPGWSIVRPGAVYGPRDRDFLQVFKMATKGVFLKPCGAGLLSFIHVDDCVSGIINAPPNKETFLCDGRSYRWEQVASALSNAVGRRVRCIYVPGVLLKAFGAAGTAAGMISGCPAVVNADKAREMLAGDWVIPGPYRKVRYDLSEGFRDTFEWYKRNGWLREELI